MFFSNKPTLLQWIDRMISHNDGRRMWKQSLREHTKDLHLQKQNLKDLQRKDQKTKMR